MRGFHPTRRYGSPHAFRALTAGLSIEQISNALHRHPRTILDWYHERRPIPYWAVEVLELRHRAHVEQLRQPEREPIPVVGIMACHENCIDIQSCSSTQENSMSKMIAYLRGLIADANLVNATPAPLPASLSPARLRNLDQPTYLRRGMIIRGISGREATAHCGFNTAGCAAAIEG